MSNYDRNNFSGSGYNQTTNPAQNQHNAFSHPTSNVMDLDSANSGPGFGGTTQDWQQGQGVGFQGSGGGFKGSAGPTQGDFSTGPNAGSDAYDLGNYASSGLGQPQGESMERGRPGGLGGTQASVGSYGTETIGQGNMSAGPGGAAQNRYGTSNQEQFMSGSRQHQSGDQFTSGRHDDTTQDHRDDADASLLQKSKNLIHDMKGSTGNKHKSDLDRDNF